MPYIKKKGVTYGGIPNGAAGSKDPTSVVPTTVKQLTRVGGTQDFAPVTIPSAVKFSNGDTLETMIGSVATIETSPAVATHAIGDFIFYNGQIYEVIAAIAVGETLTVGTNIQATSVGEELSELKSGLTDVNIASVKLIKGTFTTGPTGNIALGVSNTGLRHVVAPIVSGTDAYLRAWISASNGGWYLTAVNPNTGSTINNTALAVRYLLVTLKSI